MRGPESRESGVGPTPAAPNPLNSLPAFTALNLHNAIQAAPPLQHNPDLAHAAATAGGDVSQNAQAIMGAHIFHNFINNSLTSVGNDVHWHLNNLTDQYTDNRPAEPDAVSPLVQPPPAHKYELLPNGDVKITANDPNAVRYTVNATGDAISVPAGEMVIPAGSSSLNYRTGVQGSDITPQQAEMLRVASLAQRNATKKKTGLAGVSDQFGAAGMPQAEVAGQTFGQTLEDKVAEATGQRSEVAPINGPAAPRKTLLQMIEEGRAQRASGKNRSHVLEDIVRLSAQNVSNPKHPDFIRATVDSLFGDVPGNSTSHTRLEEAFRTAVAGAATWVKNTFTGVGSATDKQLVNTQTELAPNHYDAYPGYGAFNPGMAVLQGATGAGNFNDFLKNTQEQYKYLYWVYKNKGEAALYDAVAPIVVSALVGGTAGAVLRASAASAELSAIRAGATEAEASAAADGVLGDATNPPAGNGPLTAPSRVRTPSGKPPKAPTPNETPSYVRGENTYPDYAPKAKAGEVKNQFVTAAEMNGSTSGITLPNSVASSVKESINQALNDLWNAVDKGHWSGLKSNPAIVHDIHSMTDYGETALNNRLAEMRAATPDMTDAEFDVAHRAAQRVMADKVNEFHDLGKANFEAGKTYRGASWVGQKAVGMSKAMKAAIKPVDWLSRNDAWSGAQVGSFVLSKQLHPDWWDEAQKTSMQSIGQMVFDGTPLSGVTSGIADAFVALTSGPIPVGHLFARGGVAGEATNVTANDIDHAWAQGFGAGTFRNALRQMEGRTPGEVVQMYRELAAPADAEGNSIASKLARADENGKMVFGAAEDTYKRFRALTFGESYASLAKLPTTSIYGYLRAGKVDGGKFINWMSQTFGRMPFTIDQMGHLVNRAIQYNDPQAPNLVADMLRTIGYDHNEINAVVDKMLANSQDRQLWQDTVQAVLKDVMGHSVANNVSKILGTDSSINIEQMLKALKQDRKWLKNFEKGKVELTPQEEADLRRWISEKEAILGPHEPFIRELHKQIDIAAKELVGAPGPTPIGSYAFKHAGGVEGYNDISTLENGSKGGVGLKQTGIMYIPSYKDINRAIYEIVHWSTLDSNAEVADLASKMSAGDKAAYWMTHRPQMASEWINRVFNNAFFKPLALLTGGWATRVSMSELAINTPRHGLRDMGAGFASQNLIKQQEIANWRITQKVASMADSPEAYRFTGPFPTGGNIAEHLVYDPSAPGMRTVVGASYDNSLKREAELDRRVANNIANRNKPTSERGRGAFEGVVDRLRSDNKQNFMRSAKLKYGEDVSLETATAFKEETRRQIEEVDKFTKIIGEKMFSAGPNGGIRIENIHRAILSNKYGDYDFVSNNARLFGNAFINGSVTHTTIHELWHMLSQYVDESQIKNLESELIRARSKFLLKNNPVEFAKKQIADLDNTIETLPSSHPALQALIAERKWWNEFLGDGLGKARNISGDNHGIWSEIPMSYLGTEGYRLRNVDEWFAENLTDMYFKYDSVTNPIIQLAHRLMDMFWSAMSKVIGVGRSKAIFVDFLKKRYSEADWNFGSLQYRGGISNADFAEMKDGANAWRITSPESINSKITAKYGATQAIQGVKNSAMDSAVSREISLVVRGMMSGADQTILAGIGKAEFADAAIELMWKHDGYLPDSVGAIHNSPYREIELSQYDRQMVRKRGTRTKAPRSKLVGTTGNYIGVSFGGQGYFAGWQNMARWISEDDVLYRPVANIYRDLYDTGLRGEQLRLAAIDRTEAFLRSKPDYVVNQIERSQVPHAAAISDDPMRAWAESKVDNLEYTVHGWKGEIGAAKDAAHFHGQLLNDIADGNVPHDLNTFIRKYATKDNGRMMPHSMMPHSTISPQADVWKMGEGGGFVNSLATRGHQKLLGPVVNHLTRNPLYIVNYVNASKKIAPLVEQGLLTADQASVMAEIRATRDMLPTIHNPLDKTKFEEMLTTAFPFYFAQNQAWRRMGRLFASDPGAFMQYYISMSAVAQTVQNITKNSGLGVVAIPLTLLLFGVPLTASFTSMAVIDPFSTPSDTQGPTSTLTKAVEMFGPHAGWVPQVLGHIVLLDAPGIVTNSEAFKAKARKIAESQMVVGPIGSSENLLDAAVPNSILKAGKQEAIALLGGNPEKMAPTGAFSAPAYIQAYTEARSSILYEEMKKKAESLKNSGLSREQQRMEVANYISQKFNPEFGGNDYNQLISQSRNMALLTLTGKLVVGAISPLSVGIGDTNPQVRKLRDKLSANPALGFNGAINKIYQDEPWYSAEMMFKTKSKYGNYIPENQLVYKFVQDNAGMLSDNPLAAWAFGPDVTKDPNYFQPALQAMIDAGLRTRSTPEEMLKSFFVQLGWSTYYNDIVPAAKKQAEQYKSSGITQNDGKPFTESYLRGEMVKTLQKDNPSWSFKTGAKAAAGQRAVDQLKSMMYDSKYKDLQNSHRPLIQHLEQFFNAPDGYPMLAKYQEMVKKRQLTSEEAKATWVDGTVADWVARYPDLAPAMHTIFANLG